MFLSLFDLRVLKHRMPGVTTDTAGVASFNECLKGGWRRLYPDLYTYSEY